jgi:hypothetical protein
MERIRLYRHPERQHCAGCSRTRHRFDWLDRPEDSTEKPSEIGGEFPRQDASTAPNSA